MKKEPTELARDYLNNHGLSERSLSIALKFFRDKGEKNSKGRPDNDLQQALVFLLYFDAVQKRGLSEKSVTNRWLTDNANAIRKVTIRNHYGGMLSDEQRKLFGTEIKEPTVRVWRRRFRKLREDDQARFEEAYLILSESGQ